jgi:ATP-dependent RNA helicase DDX41
MDPEERTLEAPLKKRYRKEESSSESEDYVPYVPVKERKKQQYLKLGRMWSAWEVLE